MRIQGKRFIHAVAIALMAIGATIPAVQADDDDDDGWFSWRHSEKQSERQGGKNGGENRGKSARSAPVNAKFQQECSTCHIAYAPRLLPAESWRKMMAGLDKHFDSDASLSEEDNEEITAFLVSNASNRWSAPTAPLRISEAGWFKREHNDRHVKPAVWSDPRVKSPANCGACHPGADRGNFSEHEIKILR